MPFKGPYNARKRALLFRARPGLFKVRFCLTRPYQMKPMLDLLETYIEACETYIETP